MSEVESKKHHIIFSDTLRGAHSLVSETRKSLESAERDEEGFLKRSVEGCLSAWHSRAIVLRPSVPRRPNWFKLRRSGCIAVPEAA